MTKKPLPFVPAFEEGEPIQVQYRNPYEWIESSYLDDRSSQTEYMGRTVTERRLSVLNVFVCAIIIIFTARSAYLQIFKGTGFAALAERNKTKIQIIQAHRGIFYDAHHTILVRNIPDFSIVLTPADLPSARMERDDVLTTLSSSTGKDQRSIENEVSAHDRYRPFILAEHIPYEQALQLETALYGISGIDIAVSEKRMYEMTPYKSASHIFGYTGRISEEQLSEHRDEYMLTDSIGKSALELAFENTVRGIAGRREIEVDALGRERGIVSERASQDGSNLILSLDWNMQKKAEEVLNNVMKKTGKKKGVIIVSNPRNGEILSYASLPAYDSNAFAQGISADTYASLLLDPHKPLMSRGTMGEYPSGSTIKMLVAAAALQEKIITKATTISSTGGIHIGEWFFPDWKPGGHGTTNVVKALAESVNTFFYTIGGGYQKQAGLGIDMLTAYLNRFGIGEETHIDFQKERSGFLPTPEWKMKSRNEPWYIGDTYHISIGQGDILVTPLQVHLYTSYFAQNGINYIPHIVHAIQSRQAQDERSTEVKPAVYKQGIVSEETVAIVREGLRAGVTNGSSRRLSLLPVSAAGKTGTAQWSSSKSPHAWFTGWAPYDHPKIVLTVIIEEGEEGSRTAMSVASDFMQWYFKEYEKTASQ